MHQVHRESGAKPVLRALRVWPVSRVPQENRGPRATQVSPDLPAQPVRRVYRVIQDLRVIKVIPVWPG